MSTANSQPTSPRKLLNTELSNHDLAREWEQRVTALLNLPQENKNDQENKAVPDDKIVIATATQAYNYYQKAISDPNIATKTSIHCDYINFLLLILQKCGDKFLQVISNNKLSPKDVTKMASNFINEQKNSDFFKPQLVLFETLLKDQLAPTSDRTETVAKLSN